MEQFEARLLLSSAPNGANGAVNGFEDTAYVFSTADFGFSDTNDSPPNTFVGVNVASLPAAGTLAENNTGVAAGRFVPLATIAAGKLTLRRRSTAAASTTRLSRSRCATAVA